MKILTIPQIDMSQCPFNLPVPSLKNNGGYRIVILDGKPALAYSPIDLTVCGLTALHNGEQSIDDLSKWFVNNIVRIGEQWININVLVNNQVHTYTIAEWKLHAKTEMKIMKLL